MAESCSAVALLCSGSLRFLSTTISQGSVATSDTFDAWWDISLVLYQKKLLIRLPVKKKMKIG